MDAKPFSRFSLGPRREMTGSVAKHELISIPTFNTTSLHVLVIGLSTSLIRDTVSVNHFRQHVCSTFHSLHAASYAQPRYVSTCHVSATTNRKHLASNDMSNIQISLFAITDKMADHLQEDAATIPTEARLPTPFQLPTFSGNKQRVEAVGFPPTLLLSCSWNRRCNRRRLRVQSGRSACLT